MFDSQSIFEGWQDDATLFPAAKHYDFLNLDDLFNLPKDNNDAVLTDQWSGLHWLEENVKLNIDNDPNSFTNPPNEIDKLINECFKSLPDLLQLDPESFISPTDDMKTDVNDSIVENNSSVPSSPVTNDIPLSPPSYDLISEAGSPESYISDVPVDSTFLSGLCLSPASPCSDCTEAPPVVSVTVCKDEEVGDDPPVPMTFEEVASLISEAGSPESYISDVPVDSTFLSGLCLSPASPSSDCTEAPPVVSVTVCKDEEVGDDPPVPMTFEEVASSVKKRRYLRAGGGGVPKVQVSLENTFEPYSRAKPTSRRRRANDPAERKKVQNKEAAARYRMKKRSEEKVLADEVDKLEKEQKELQGKCDNIMSEIKYLKSLTREMFQKKGLM